MQQNNIYTIEDLGTNKVTVLNREDSNLIKDYVLGNISFVPTKYALDLEIRDLEDNYVETLPNISTYSIPGSVKSGEATEIIVKPLEDLKNSGYLGDVNLRYSVFNNLYSSDRTQDTRSELYVADISTDRTEIRAKSVTISQEDLGRYTDNLYRKLNDQVYFPVVFLKFEETTCTVINVMTEVIGDDFYVTFKLYEPLEASVLLRSKFSVQEQIGESSNFRVLRSVEVIGDEPPRLKGPNFNLDIEEVSYSATDYLNYNQLFSYPVSSSYNQLFSLYTEKGAQIGIDHTDYKNFIHFSSASERLQNFRYKLSLIKRYESEISELEETVGDQVIAKRNRELIQGILSNFDHYDQFLYFESGSKAWPKSTYIRPYENIDPEDPSIAEWWENALAEAEYFDENNSDALVNTIPVRIRESEQNEAYTVFIHMIGQHFDDEWIYAKSMASRYDADNRLDFGISKDLVWKAIEGFGLKLYKSNQSLDALFDRCNLSSNFCYDTGSESTVRNILRITNTFNGHPEPIYPPTQTFDGEEALWLISGSTIDGWYASSSGSLPGIVVDSGGATVATVIGNSLQPTLADDYHKEVYKRIYHNLPFLIKTKGTARGLRALVSCFGIPDDILEINVLGGSKVDTTGSFFGPEIGTTSSINRIRLDATGSEVPFIFESGSFKEVQALSKDVPVRTKSDPYSDSSHEIELGFRLNKQLDDYIQTKISSSFSYDDIIGDARNTGENYGASFSLILYQILEELSGDNVLLRSPSGILRLIRYFDSTLFKSLQEFLPARSSVVAGAVVDDHLLHRNRYAGFDIKESPHDTDPSGTIEMVYIDGGAGGSINLRPKQKLTTGSEQPVHTFTAYGKTITRTAPTVDFYRNWTVGIYTGSKAIFDDSPIYNGELSGSEYEVVSGELNPDNPYKKAESKQTPYRLNLKFLCLPEGENIYCNLDSVGSEVGRILKVYSALGTPTYATEASLEEGIYYRILEPGNQTGYVYIPSGSSVGDLTLRAFSADSQGRFLGWYKHEEVIKIDDRGSYYGSFITSSAEIEIDGEDTYTARFSIDNPLRVSLIGLANDPGEDNSVIVKVRGLKSGMFDQILLKFETVNEGNEQKCKVTVDGADLETLISVGSVSVKAFLESGEEYNRISHGDVGPVFGFGEITVQDDGTISRARYIYAKNNTLVEIKEKDWIIY